MYKYIHYSVFLLLFNASTAQSKIAAHAVNDITFWAGQMAEHAEFASDFTNDATLKQEGLALAEKFKKNLKHLSNPDIELIPTFLELSKNIKDYQARVRTYLKKRKNEYPGKALSLDLLDHMDLETDYAVKKAEGKKLSKNEEVAFWSKEHEGEAKVIATLANQGSEAQEVKKEAEQVKSLLGSNHRFWNNSLEKAEKGNAELNALAKKIDENPSINKIPAKLAKHEERERKRAQETFRKLELEK